MDYLVSFQCFGYIVSMVFKIYSQRIMVRTEIWNIHMMELFLHIVMELFVVDIV